MWESQDLLKRITSTMKVNRKFTCIMQIANSDRLLDRPPFGSRGSTIDGDRFLCPQKVLIQDSSYYIGSRLGTTKENLAQEQAMRKKEKQLQHEWWWPSFTGGINLTDSTNTSKNLILARSYQLPFWLNGFLKLTVFSDCRGEGHYALRVSGWGLSFEL